MTRDHDMRPMPDKRNAPKRPNAEGGPPRQVERLKRYLDQVQPGWESEGLYAVDAAIAMLAGQRDLVDLALAVVKGAGIAWPLTTSEEHPLRVSGLRPYRRRPAVVAAFRLGPGLDNVGMLLSLLPASEYRVEAVHGEVRITNLSTNKLMLAWPGDSIVRSADGGWTVVEHDDFEAMYEPLPPTASDRTSTFDGDAEALDAHDGH